ncbi:MAG: Gfo/Idh/MocA family oxidoreductase [Pseudonocardiales bacterium]|nr:Gfo/Idh/MocA family oxidoreductase [Pseudonocardiales bacterium]
MTGTPGKGNGVRWGILGTGRIAGAFTRDLLLSGASVSAVGSRSRNTADEFAATFSLETAHGSYEELVDDPNVDAVYIATPHPQHHPNALLALSAGKHVLIEKPIAMNAIEARDIAEAAEAHNLVALEAMWTRFLPHMVRIRELVAAKAIGQITAFTADHTQLLSTDPAHRINALELGGGALLDLGIYSISFASELLGHPDAISAAASFKQTGADSQVATAFGYAGGQVATTLCSSIAKGQNVASILGTEGRIDIASVWYTATEFTRYDQAGEIAEHFRFDVPGRGMHYQALELESLVRQGTLISRVMPISESVTIMETVDEIRAQIGLHYPTD